MQQNPFELTVTSPQFEVVKSLEKFVEENIPSLLKPVEEIPGLSLEIHQYLVKEQIGKVNCSGHLLCKTTKLQPAVDQIMFIILFPVDIFNKMGH